MANKLSHTQLSRYMTCPRSYELYYKKKIRPTGTSSALVFGSALDAALEALLTGNDWQLAYDKAMTMPKINGVPADYAQADIRYSTKDTIIEILTDGDIEKLSWAIPSELSSDLHDALASVASMLKQAAYRPVPDYAQIFADRVAWQCLYRKGHIMVAGFIQEVLPRITKIYSTQEKVLIENDEGDSSIGYMDAVVEWDGKDIVFLDFKTAARPYEPDAVVTSVQLSKYIFAAGAKYNTRKAGYIVLPKTFENAGYKECGVCGHVAEGSHKTCNAVINGKRCGGDWIVHNEFKCVPQILIDDIPESTEQAVVENYNVLNSMIKMGLYPKNFNSCHGKYGKCEYYDLCWANKMAGLTAEEDK